MISGKRPSINGIGSDRLEVQGRGDVTVLLANGKPIVLKNVAYVPDATANIFSVTAALRQLKQTGVEAEQRTTLRSTKVVNSKTGEAILTETLLGGLYYLDVAKRELSQ